MDTHLSTIVGSDEGFVKILSVDQAVHRQKVFESTHRAKASMMMPKGLLKSKAKFAKRHLHAPTQNKPNSPHKGDVYMTYCILGPLSLKHEASYSE